MLYHDSFPKLKRYRIDWNGKDFEDSAESIDGDEPTGGLEILSSPITPHHWGIFSSGVHSLSQNSKTVNWIPVSEHRRLDEVWDKEQVNAIRCKGVTVYNTTAPVVVIADVHASTKTEIAINAAFFDYASYKEPNSQANHRSFAGLLTSLFQLDDNHFPEVAIWIVRHEGRTNFFRPEIVFERRASRDAGKSAQQLDTLPRTIWKDIGPQCGDRLTLAAIDLTRLIGSAITRIMKPTHSH